jgi:peptidoglycan/xylan/chitin deacetylase (PgdA/CDA1 family)
MTNSRLTYPFRRSGLDHGWFPHQPTNKRRRVSWPGGKPVVLWITVPVEFFPLDAPAQPFRPLGGLMLGYPDLWNASSRDYGLRIGIYRIMQVLDGFNLRATAAVNAAAVAMYPRVFDEMAQRQWEFMANGLDMGHVHHGGVGLDQERELIRKARDAVAMAASGPVHGWHSPGRSQSRNTLTLVAEHGFTYVTDWANDDMPYVVTTPSGELCALPLTYEWSDRNLLVQHNLTVDEYAAQVLQAFTCLAGEAEHYESGRILSLSVTPWIVGYPHRVAALERLLGRILDSGSVWNANGVEIVEAFRKQSPATA